MRTTGYLWALDSAGNAYLNQVTTTLDPGLAWSQSTTSTQTLDTSGNVLTLAVTDFRGASTRTYTNSYLYGGAPCGPPYVCNRLLTSTVNTNNTTVNLVTNTYDGNVLTSPQNGLPREHDSNYASTGGGSARGNLTTSVTPGHTVNTYYDTDGTVTIQNDNNGHSVNVATSPLSNFTAPEQLAPNGSTQLATNALYNTPTFAPTSVAPPYQSVFDPGSDPTGTAAYTTYDGWGRVSYVYPTGGYPSNAFVSYVYLTGTPWTTTATTSNLVTGDNLKQSVQTQTMDGLGRTASVSTQASLGGQPISETDTAYAPVACSPLGKMSSRTQPYLPPQSSPPTTTYQYDALGRTTAIALPDGSTTQYLYQGNVTTVTDPAGNWKQYTNDAFGNLVTVLEPNPAAGTVNPPVPATNQYPLGAAPANSNSLFTGYSYDQLNHLLTVTMPRSTGTQTRTFNYNPTTQFLTSATNPENGTISYAYNPDSTLLTKTYNNGNYEQYSYDTYQRLTEIQRFVYNANTHTATENVGDRATYSYDTLNNVSYPGLLTTSTFATGLGANNWTLENLYTYTPTGQVATKTLSVAKGGTSPSGSLTVGYGYDGLGTLASIQYPSSTTFTYTLDSLERPTALTDNTNYSWASAVAYNPANQITSATFPSGAQTWMYNTLNQLYQRTTTSGSTTRLNMTYTYTAGENNGQIASSADAVTGETVAYQYDSLKRLVGATSSPLPPVNGTAWSEAYGYDGFGNLTGMTPTGSGSAPALSVSVNPATNQISPTNIAYDGNGNVTQFGPSGSLTNLTYDVSNRLATVNSNNAYAYSSTNQRVYFHNSAGTESLYIYGQGGKKLATYTVSIANNQVSFTLQSQNVYFAGKLISAEGNAVAVDRLGSVRWNAASGAHTYYPFGAEYNATPNNTEKYATYTRDNLTGLDYAMNRYFYSAWGRFMSPDGYMASAHLGNPHSWNRYTYTTSDPINRRDASGKDDDDDDDGGDDGVVDSYCDENGNCTFYSFPFGAIRRCHFREASQRVEGQGEPCARASCVPASPCDHTLRNARRLGHAF